MLLFDIFLCVLCCLPTLSFVLAGVPGGGWGLQLEHDPEEELAVLDQLIEWQRQTGEYGDAAK